MAEYAISDAPGIELLTLAAEATDRAASLRAQIQRDGVAIKGKGRARKVHPCVKAEATAMALVARCLARLNLDTAQQPSPGWRPT